MLLLALCVAVASLPAQVESGPTSRPQGPTIPADTEIKTTASGLKYSVLKAGAPNGEMPQVNDRVKVHYTGWLTDGTIFDSSVQRGQPAEFGVSQVIPGWTEGLQLMTPGARFKFTIPSELAYGARAQPKIPANSTLIFEVELLGVTKGPAPLPMPPFPGADGEGFTTTASGLKYKMLAEGEGTSPTKASTVTAHYAGWLADGKKFDASFPRGTPATFPLARVIPGWQEGVALMKPGAKYVFIIPPALGYQDRDVGGGLIPPNSTLIFHVELISVK
jgi:peptidylprolyl isomerase